MVTFFCDLFCMGLCARFILVCFDCELKISNSELWRLQMLFPWLWHYFIWKCFSGGLVLVWSLESVNFQMQSYYIIFSFTLQLNFLLIDPLHMMSQIPNSALTDVNGHHKTQTAPSQMSMKTYHWLRDVSSAYVWTFPLLDLINGGQCKGSISTGWNTHDYW